MKYKILLKIEAIQDMTEAFDWYEHQKSGLGTQFLDEVEKTLNLISQSPKQYPLIQNHRMAILHRFPYKIVFQVETENIIVFAVYHDKRNPEQLIDRD